MSVPTREPLVGGQVLMTWWDEIKRSSSGSRTNTAAWHWGPAWRSGLLLVAYAVAIKLGIDVDGVSSKGGILLGAWVAARSVGGAHHADRQC